MVKTTGAEFHAFYNDREWWPLEDDDRDIHHEDEIITVNGVECEDEYDGIKLSDVVRIDGGMVYEWSADDRKDREIDSFEGYFKKWRKAQKTATLVVTIDKSKVDDVIAAIKLLGGKVAK